MKYPANPFSFDTNFSGFSVLPDLAIASLNAFIEIKQRKHVAFYHTKNESKQVLFL